MIVYQISRSSQENLFKYQLFGSEFAHIVAYVTHIQQQLLYLDLLQVFRIHCIQQLHSSFVHLGPKTFREFQLILLGQHLTNNVSHLLQVKLANIL